MPIAPGVAGALLRLRSPRGRRQPRGQHAADRAEQVTLPGHARVAGQHARAASLPQYRNSTTATTSCSRTLRVKMPRTSRNASQPNASPDAPTVRAVGADQPDADAAEQPDGGVTAIHWPSPLDIARNPNTSTGSVLASRCPQRGAAAAPTRCRRARRPSADDAEVVEVGRQDPVEQFDQVQQQR